MTTAPLEQDAPAILLQNPKPQSEIKSFHRRKIQVWAGHVHVVDVHPWADNKRTELHVEQWKAETGAPPDDEDLYQIVTQDEMQKIQPLADNIRQNGVRVPIILAADGRLLDGNRRYFAQRMNLKRAKPEEKVEFERLPAWVLAKETGPEDELNVITERNLVDDQRLEWPYSVQARQVYEDHVDQGMSIKDIAAKYDATTSRIRQMIQAVELAEDFVGYHADKDHDGHRARRIVYENLIWFDQVRRSHSKLVNEDAEFRNALFDMIFEQPAKFMQARDFLKLGEIRSNDAAWEKLTSVAGRAGLEQAQQVLAAEKADSARDAAGKLERATKLLDEAVGSGQLAGADPTLLARFHKVAARVPDGPSDVLWRIERMQKWLDEMTVEEVSKLGPKAVDRLKQSHERLMAMNKAWQRKQA
jgi:hypothetical protein